MWSSTLIDEFSYRKRHHYLTVVVDRDTRRVVWAGKGRSAETLDGFFNLLGPSGCEGIALVTVDLAASWQKALRARVPHARVVFDRFHVERLASDAVDEVRRAEQRRVGAKAAKALKGTRFCLLKHPARLKPGEKRRLETLRRQNRALDRAYRLKEYLAIPARLGASKSQPVGVRVPVGVRLTHRDEVYLPEIPMPSGPDRPSDRAHNRAGTPVTSPPGWMFWEASTRASPVPTSFYTPYTFNDSQYVRPGICTVAENSTPLVSMPPALR